MVPFFITSNTSWASRTSYYTILAGINFSRILM